jgi:parallel beta-helix repeat protein
MMKKFILFFVFTFSIISNAQKTYYISSSQGNDSNNGLSENASWKTIAKLQAFLPSAIPGDKFLLKSGDTWTDRGNKSTTYSGLVGLDLTGVHGTSDKYITIGSYSNGEKPKFNFAGTGAVIQLTGATYIKIQNLIMTSIAEQSNRPKWGIHAIGSIGGGAHNVDILNCVLDGLQMGIVIQDANHTITIEGCEIKNSSSGSGIFANVTNLTIRNNTIRNNGRLDNGYDHQIYLQDAINALIEGNNITHNNEGGGGLISIAGADGITIRHNTIYNSNWSAIIIGDRYKGVLAGGQELYYVDNALIEKNIIYNCPRGIDIRATSSLGPGDYTSLVIKNNIIYNANVVGIRTEDLNLFSNSIIANNTLYNNLVGIRFGSGVTYSNVIAKNNIIYNNQYSTGCLLEVSNASHLSNIDLNNNLFYSTVGNDTKVGSTTRSLELFKSAFPNDEQNSKSLNPSFKNPSSFDFHLTENSSAINIGAHLSSLGVNNDFDGNPRPSGNGFDIGAYEIVTTGGGSGGGTGGSLLNLNIKVFLEGPYNNGNMNAAISGYLPLSQPYSSAPWSYNGTESVTSIPQGVVDWVLIELRSGTSASTIAARKAVFLKSDGSVVDLDGTSKPSFTGVNDGSYYLIVKHRNHLSVMSSNPVSLSSNSGLYDFTTGLDKAFGSESLTSLGSGIWGMFAGDGDLNGIINVIDYGSVGNSLFETGYKLGDIDMNGTINVIDYGKTNSNLFKSSQVPN